MNFAILCFFIFLPHFPFSTGHFFNLPAANNSKNNDFKRYYKNIYSTCFNMNGHLVLSDFERISQKSNCLYFPRNQRAMRNTWFGCEEKILHNGHIVHWTVLTVLSLLWYSTILCLLYFVTIIWDRLHRPPLKTSSGKMVGGWFIAKTYSGKSTHASHLAPPYFLSYQN